MGRPDSDEESPEYLPTASLVESKLAHLCRRGDATADMAALRVAPHSSTATAKQDSFKLFKSSMLSGTDITKNTTGTTSSLTSVTLKANTFASLFISCKQYHFLLLKNSTAKRCKSKMHNVNVELTREQYRCKNMDNRLSKSASMVSRGGEYQDRRTDPTRVAEITELPWTIPPNQNTDT
jgi:hypothetical protein